MDLKIARFNSKEGADFQKTLRTRVDEYFTKNKISKNANGAMVFKTIAILAMCFVPFTSLFVFELTGWMFFLAWFVMGVGIAGVGMAIMHDANHGSYSSNTKVNTIIGKVIGFAGGHDTNWKIQHNVLHHTYTNVDGLDEDINPPGNLLRFSPHQPLLKQHKYQYLYAWFFYGLMTLMWSLTKDFQQLNRFSKKGMLKAQRTTYGTELRKILTAKVLYFAFILGLPMIFLSASWWSIILGYLLMHYTAGLILSLVFQLAHVMEGVEYPEPDENGSMEYNWAVHQLQTTADFAHNNRLLSWYVGGLNFQIEHHLFPNICHVHYKHIAKIVEATAKEFEVPYHTFPTFTSALAVHVRMLKQLGRA